MELWGKRAQPERYRNFLDVPASTANNLAMQPYSHVRVSEGVGQIVKQLRQRSRDVPEDNTGHGTHVAGIILQLCPEANLYVGRVLERNVTEDEEETRAAARRLALVSSYMSSISSLPYAR
jgi:subtilisin family serine protease